MSLFSLFLLDRNFKVYLHINGDMLCVSQYACGCDSSRKTNKQTNIHFIFTFVTRKPNSRHSFEVVLRSNDAHAQKLSQMALRKNATCGGNSQPIESWFSTIFFFRESRATFFHLNILTVKYSPKGQCIIRNASKFETKNYSVVIFHLLPK